MPSGHGGTLFQEVSGAAVHLSSAYTTTTWDFKTLMLWKWWGISFLQVATLPKSGKSTFWSRPVPAQCSVLNHKSHAVFHTVLEHKLQHQHHCSHHIGAGGWKFMPPEFTVNCSAVHRILIHVHRVEIRGVEAPHNFFNFFFGGGNTLILGAGPAG